MNIQSYNITYLLKNISGIKPYNMCCICMEKSNEVKKCFRCIDGVICYNCCSRLKNEHIYICPICRNESNSFITKSKINLPYQKVGNLVILYTFIFIFDQLLPYR